MKAAENPFFDKWLMTTKRLIKSTLMTTKSEAAIIITCVSGVRRSVAEAEILFHVLKNVEGHRMSPTLHMSKIAGEDTHNPACEGECAE